MDENGYIMQEGEELQENLLITFDMEDGVRKEYALMGMFVADVFQYMALVPTDPEDMNIVIVPYEEGEDGMVEFRDFYSDEEYDKAEEAFQVFAADNMEDDLHINPEDVLEEVQLQEEDYLI